MTGQQIDLVLAGSAPEWEALARQVFELAERIARRGPARSEDLPRDVASRVLEKLRARDGAALRAYVAAQRKYPAMTFDGWLTTVVRHALVDHVRALPEIQRRRSGTGRHLQAVEVVPLSEATEPRSDANDVDLAAEAARLVRVLIDELPERQQQAIAAWLRGDSHEETADALGLAAPEESQRLLNAARQRLRRRFSEPRSARGNE